MKTEKNILELETVALLDDENAIEIIDQTLLPGRTELIRLRTWNAIYLLQVRGAPAIGVTAGFGIYLLTKLVNIPEESDIPEKHDENFAILEETFRKQKAYLDSSRPTAVNLSWALNRMEKVFLSMKDNRALTMRDVKERLRQEAEAIKDPCKARRRNPHALQCGQAVCLSLRHCDSTDLSRAGARLRFPCICG